MRMLRTLARGTESGFENISKTELRKKVRRKRGRGGSGIQCWEKRGAHLSAQASWSLGTKRKCAPY